jgi:hypothetical protein
MRKFKAIKIMSPLAEIKEQVGPAVTPKQLAELLGLDPKTVIKYAHVWGGVEVLPGTVRFFENLVKERIENEAIRSGLFELQGAVLDP